MGTRASNLLDALDWVHGFLKCTDLKGYDLPARQLMWFIWWGLSRSQANRRRGSSRVCGWRRCNFLQQWLLWTHGSILYTGWCTSTSLCTSTSTLITTAWLCHMLSELYIIILWKLYCWTLWVGRCHSFWQEWLLGLRCIFSRLQLSRPLMTIVGYAYRIIHFITFSGTTRPITMSTISCTGWSTTSHSPFSYHGIKSLGRTCHTSFRREWKGVWKYDQWRRWNRCPFSHLFVMLLQPLGVADMYCFSYLEAWLVRRLITRFRSRNGDAAFNVSSDLR